MRWMDPHISLMQLAMRLSTVAQHFLNKALDLLVAGGVPKNDVAVILQKRKVGIARDIIEESLRGYKAIVIGRGGLSRPGQPFLGSVSNKIVEKIQDTPVWVIGRDIRTKKMLLPVDASENARKAVNYVGNVSIWHFLDKDIWSCRERRLPCMTLRKSSSP